MCKLALVHDAKMIRQEKNQVAGRRRGSLSQMRASRAQRQPCQGLCSQLTQPAGLTACCQASCLCAALPLLSAPAEILVILQLSPHILEKPPCFLGLWWFTLCKRQICSQRSWTLGSRAISLLL